MLFGKWWAQRKKEKQATASLSALMAQTNDSMVLFSFRQPVDPQEPQEVIDAKLRDAFVVEASAPFARYFGFQNRADIIGQHLLKLFGGQIPDWFVDYGQLSEDQGFADIERIIPVPVGNEIHPMRVHVKNMFDGNKLISQWLTVRDVSEEEAQRQALEDNERLKLLALEAIGLQTFTLHLTQDGLRDQAGDMVLTNNQRPEWWYRINPEDRPILEESFENFIRADNDLLHTIFRIRTPSGEQAWMECWAVASKLTRRATPKSIVGVLMDRTQSKALESQLMASQRLESLGVMAGGIAHDFNNLLVSIIGSLDLTVSRHPDLAEDLKVIDGAARQASQLCDQLLTYAGRGSTQQTSLDLHSVVTDIEELLALNVDSKVHLDFNLQPNCWVRGDGAQLTQVFMNLTKNASDALERQSGRISVSMQQVEFKPEWRNEYQLGAELSQQDHIEVIVEDDGKGISQANLERLFDPFFTTKRTGRGLGLAVVMGIVRAHNGAINVTSKKGLGTRISVLLPSAAEQTQTLSAPTENSEDRLNGCVLVVDDEAAVRSIAQRLLQAIGLETVLAESGSSALELVAEDPERFDVILLDVSMPGLDGVETANMILEQSPQTRILMCSGYSAVKLPQMLTESVDFLQKPYRLNQLREKLTPLLH